MNLFNFRIFLWPEDELIQISSLNYAFEVSFWRPTMFRVVFSAAMERADSCFKRVKIASDSLREFQPGLVLDDVEDLVNWEVQER